MRIIYKIAKTELQMLFYSPIAWLLLVCFVVQTALYFTSTYTAFVDAMAARGTVFNASMALFTKMNPPGLWAMVQNLIYLYIPLLTMGVISKMLDNGSIKLLYSSPVSTAHIILGKYLAMVFYSLMLIAILFIYVIFGWCTIENFEIAWVLTGLLGLFLLICTYMAVGIFVSSLTTYQVVAVVGTFVILMFLGMIGRWGQQYDFVREVTYWLSINGRASTFIEGMLCSEDLLYFPVVTVMFLALTVIRLHAVREKQRTRISLGKYSLVVLTVCVIAYVSSRPALLGYYDTTSAKRNTLTLASQEIVKQAKGGMKITAYVNVLDKFRANNLSYSFMMYNRDFFRRYTRFKPEIELDYVYYYADVPEQAPKGGYDQTAWVRAKNVCEMFERDSSILLTKEEIDKVVDLSEEGYTFVWQLERESGEKEWLRVFDKSPLPSEAEVSAAIKRMVMRLPKIGFVTGHRERDIHTEVPQGYNFLGNNKKFQYSVWNQGFDVTEISLRDGVPDDVDIVIIGDLRVELTPEEEFFLQKYIDKGGNLFILGEPRHREAVNPMLRKFFGVELTPLVVGYDNKDVHQADALNCVPTLDAEQKIYHVKYYTFRILMPTSSGVDLVEDKGYTLYPLLTCNPKEKFWTELETVDIKEDTVKFNPVCGEVSKDFTTLVGLTREVGNKEQRILISGDADCLSNGVVTNGGSGPQNYTLFLGAGYWLSHERAPVDVRRAFGTDHKVFLSEAGNRMMRIGFLWMVPLAFACGGIFVWIRRRGR